MVSWQITAKTIYCGTVEDEVTLIIHRDGTATCTGLKKYGEPNRVMQKIIKKKVKQFNRPMQCEGLQCPRLTAYKEKIFAEEIK
jgi:hypothetical protein